MCDVCIAEHDSGLPESCLFDEVVTAYANDPDYADIIPYLRAPTDVALEALSRSKRDHTCGIRWMETCSYTASIHSTPLAL